MREPVLISTAEAGLPEPVLGAAERPNNLFDLWAEAG